MKKKFSVEQIVSVLKQSEVGVPVAELIRKVGISEQTFYRWKAKYMGLEVDQVRQLKQLRDENTRLKQLVAELTLDKTMLQDVLSEKVVKPSRRRPMVKYFEQSYRVSERHACCVLELARATYRYEGHQEQWIELRMRIREIAQTRVRYGYRMIRVLLNREGWKVGKDLVYRLYKEEGLGLRKRPVGRRRAVVHRQERFRPTGPNQVWAMDFVADQLCDGRRFRSLTIVDIYTRESLAIEVGQSLRGEDVVRVLNRLKEQRGVPKLLFCDNGSEFTGQMLDLWAYRNSVKIDFSRPGKPTDNAFVESFNGTFRSECLDTNWFQNLTEAKQIIEAWRREYNESRPHRALANRTPEEFTSQIAVNRDLAETKTSRFLTL
ncbi:IS3 family transposase [Tunturiibacter gelidiferens]|uniref:IS3 family transposase n=1 Tax=Tunturiibacter gelidiferens TaxID=3069689 RepID=UPI003D9B4BE9